MKALSDPLWQKLADFSFDSPDAHLTFTLRLARENDWSPSYARRVIDEYRCFLFLAMRAGHPVTPSDAVDQAWHLHLVYTESYWNELCPQVLGRPLHHGPTKGGASEKVKFEDWYERTRQSYRAHFGENPPLDIWPPAAVRFAPATRAPRVCPDDAWIIPKPRILRRRAAAPAYLAIGLVPLLLALTDDEFSLLFGICLLGLILVVVAAYRRSRGKRNDKKEGRDTDAGCGGCGDGGSGCGGGGD